MYRRTDAQGIFLLIPMTNTGYIKNWRRTHQWFDLVNYQIRTSTPGADGAYDHEPHTPDGLRIVSVTFQLLLHRPCMRLEHLRATDVAAVRTRHCRTASPSLMTAM